LDGDHGLVGEGLEQRYLLVREPSSGLPTHRDCSNGMSVSQHRHGKDASEVIGTRERLKLVLRVLTYVWDMDDAAGQDGGMGAACSPGTRRVRITIGVGAFRGHVMRSDEMDQLTVEPEGGTQLGVAQAEGAGGDAIEHRLDIVGRARDD